MARRTLTKVYPQCVDSDTAWTLYYALQDGIEWSKDIKSKGKPTRFGYSLITETYLDNELHPELRTALDNLISAVLKSLDVPKSRLSHSYLNYYENGEDFTPGHSHNTDQVVISLGASRILKVGSKNYMLNNGDVVIFGTSTHSVPKDKQVTQGRISIAIFLYR